jgi:hypothetical protein
MVSPTSSTDPAIETAPTYHRGFFPEETLVGVGPVGGAMSMHYRPFWRPVVAGTVFTLAIFVLSWYLMLGCRVGIDSNGAIALGAGAAIWMWITSCIAYYCGGMVASSMTMSNGSSYLKGLVIWGLSIPLALVIYAGLAQAGNLVNSVDLPRVANGTMSSAMPTGFFWANFIGLALGLIFSVIGSTTRYAGPGLARQGYLGRES